MNNYTILAYYPLKNCIKLPIFAYLYQKLGVC